MASFSVPVLRSFYNGSLASGANIFVYQTGTTTPLTTYSDGALTTPNPNPIVADINGEALFYVSTSVNLRLDIYTSTGALIRSIDPVYPAGPASATYAPLASPAFTGNPTAPTATIGDNSTTIATTAFVDTAIINSPCMPYSNLHAQSSGSGMQITADSVTVRNASVPLVSGAYNQAIDLTTSGAGGLDTGSVANANWYFGYAIYNPATVTWKAIGSTQSTPASVALPSGYTYISGPLTAGYYIGGSVNGYVQVGNKVGMTPISTLSGGGSTSFAQVVTQAIPARCKVVDFNVSPSSAGAIAILSPINGTNGQVAYTAPTNVPSGQLQVIIYTDQTFYYKINSGTLNLSASGFDLIT